MSAKRRKGATPSPRVMRPAPSPNMGKLLIGEMPPPKPKPTPSSDAPASRLPAISPGDDLLLEAMGLHQEGGAAARARRAPTVPSASDGRSAPPPPLGTAVRHLPKDMSLKRGCLVTSPHSLRWAAELSTSVQDGALRCAPGEADPSRAVRFQQSLTCWRHPSQRLPAAIAKDFAAAKHATSERAFVDTLRDAWDAALRGLYYALRAARLPYFYCRGNAFTIAWRNRVPLESSDGFGMLPPAGWQTEGSDWCCAVLCPSTGPLRAQLRAHDVPFEMPAAGGQAEEERGAFGLDGEVSSALYFCGHEALHSLYEFLINSSAHYQLSLTLLAPHPFPNGTPMVPKLVYRPNLHRGGSDAPAEESLRLESFEGGGAMLLPTMVRRLCTVLTEAQDGDFELVLSQDGRVSDGINIQAPLPQPPGGADVVRVRPSSPQPLASLDADSALPRDSSEPRGDRGDAPALGLEELPCTLNRIICSGGKLQVVRLGD
ncbi:hypothetical protein AB1Y20_007649 [Prymnesium parvum]|uniref:Uncharacterized protein n=1 Tax=Prymnesium parvum TaxID=97485 RepID=A0AB34IYL0_PRYPA